MLAKGHDFANLTLVIGLNLDNALFSYDFRASEDMFNVLTQVAGRAGRADKAGLVLLQTNYPDHPVYQFLKTMTSMVLLIIRLKSVRHTIYRPLLSMH